jgi:hypothetical protein
MVRSARCVLLLQLLPQTGLMWRAQMAPEELLARVAEPLVERAIAGWIPGFVTMIGILVSPNGLEYRQS